MQNNHHQTSSKQIKGTYHCVCLTFDEIDVIKAIQFITHPKCGGSSIFLGSTRDLEGQETIEALFYEAYEEMALKQMDKIAQKSLEDQVQHVYIVHRLGKVPVGQHSILIATSSPGRNECSGATLKILNEIKRFVPIWKRSPSSLTDWNSKSEAYWLSKNTPNIGL